MNRSHHAYRRLVGLSVLFSLALVLGSLPSVSPAFAQAPVVCTGVLDDFNAPDPAAQVHVGGSSILNPPITTASGTQTGLAGTLGGSRRIDLQLISGGLRVTAQVSAIQKYFALSSDSGTSGTAKVCYDANGAGLGADLSSLQALTFDFFRSDLSCTGGDPTMTVSDGTNTATRVRNLQNYACPDQHLRHLSRPLARLSPAGANTFIYLSLPAPFTSAAYTIGEPGGLLCCGPYRSGM